MAKKSSPSNISQLHFQVVCMDSKGYIIEFHNYLWPNIDKMLEYIEFMATDSRVAKIEVGRWNQNNERE